MGIFIHVALSKSVTQEEWEPVYEESLRMADALGLADWKEIDIHGTSVCCLTKVREEEVKDWETGKLCKQWSTCGDYYYYTLCEDNILWRTLDEIKKDAVDPLLAQYAEINGDDSNGLKKFEDDCISFWNGKTQGEPQHISLLAIGCMIATRLGDKALVYGDITRGQCRTAVKLANKVTSPEVIMPDRCDVDRFYARVSRFPANEMTKLTVFSDFYMGEKGSEFGELHYQ